MEFCHTDIFLHSAAAQRLAEFIHKRREKWKRQSGAVCVDKFEDFEQELHALVMASECEMVSEELSRYDVRAEEIEVNGKVYGRGMISTETYMTAAGKVLVERHLYHPITEEGKGICPLELRSGMVGGYFTPRAARQGAFAMAHLTPGESEAQFST